MAKLKGGLAAWVKEHGRPKGGTKKRGGGKKKMPASVVAKFKAKGRRKK